MYLYKMDESSQIFIDKIYELGDYKKNQRLLCFYVNLDKFQQ